MCIDFALCWDISNFQFHNSFVLIKYWYPIEACFSRLILCEVLPLNTTLIECFSHERLPYQNVFLLLFIILPRPQPKHYLFRCRLYPLKYLNPFLKRGNQEYLKQIYT